MWFLVEFVQVFMWRSNSMLEDSEGLRLFIKAIYPSFHISDIAKKSGQRVVYYGYFSSQSECEPKYCNQWGDVVLKISEATSRAAISYIQKEIDILKELNSTYFPKLHFSEVVTIDPRTEEPLSPIKFISIEERVMARPLSDVMINYTNECIIIDFIIRVISAMECLWEHPKKLVHRDLKPDNILIKDDGSVVIIDLGLLREEGSAGVTNSLCFFGPCTPFYASPEQAVNDKKNISFKSDLFSLGVIAYEMFNGSNPFINFEGSNYFDKVLSRVCDLTPIPLKSKGMNVKLSDVIEKMMNKHPYKRYRTYSKLLNDLIEVRSVLCQ